MKDFVSRYMDYVNLDQSEAPAIFHRWTCLSMLGALLGRNVYLPFGHSKIFPNQYVMLMGSPGARKGTAMNIGKTLAKEAGFTRFAKDKTSKERFLMDMQQTEIDSAMSIEELESINLDDPAETWILSGEFTDFIGQNNMEFITMLTNLWDNLPEYENPKIHGKSVKVHKPTVNLLGGNTPQGFALAFPPEALGNGFLSRVIFVHGESTGKKIAWPEPADDLIMTGLATQLKEMRQKMIGEMSISPDAKKLGERIYKEYVGIEDARFQHYATRRFTHLLKLAIILAAVDLTFRIDVEHILCANTVLAATERHMSKALGEFGKNRNSDIANAIISFLQGATTPKTANDLYKVVATDVKNMTELAEILANLQRAEKIQVISMAGKQGYMPKHKELKHWPYDLLVNDWLTLEELA